MHRIRPTLAFLVLVALATASAAAAGHARFDRNVCHLLSAKQVAAIDGLSPKCTNAPAAAGPGAKIYVGNWAGKTPQSPQLQVTVSVYADPGMLQLAKRNLNQGLPGAPKKVAGIGTAAYEASGASARGVRFALGKEIVLVLVSGPGTPPLRPVETLAKGVAARL